MGYLHVRLSKDGAYTLRKVHHLVAEAFLGWNSADYDRQGTSCLVVTHQNGLKSDNRLDNLKIVTKEEALNWKNKMTKEAEMHKQSEEMVSKIESDRKRAKYYRDRMKKNSRGS